MSKSVPGFTVVGLLLSLVLFAPARTTAAPAAAAAGDSGGGDRAVAGEAALAYRCPSGSFCFWQHSRARGKRFNLRTQDATFHDNPCAGCRSSKNPSSNGTWGDQASSYFNNSGETYCLYHDTGYENLMVRIAHRGRGSFGLRHNDELSSAQPC